MRPSSGMNQVVQSVLRSVTRWSRAPMAPFRRYDLRGRSVVIAGGSRGLGLALARELGAKGARLTLLARDEAGLVRAREGLVALGVAGVAVTACDIADRAQVERTVLEIVSAKGTIDVLINVAGITEVGPIEAMD